MTGAQTNDVEDAIEVRRISFWNGTSTEEPMNLIKSNKPTLGSVTKTLDSGSSKFRRADPRIKRIPYVLALAKLYVIHDTGKAENAFICIESNTSKDNISRHNRRWGNKLKFKTKKKF